MSGGSIPPLAFLFKITGGYSSVGRMDALQALGHRFESDYFQNKLKHNKWNIYYLKIVVVVFYILHLNFVVQCFVRLLKICHYHFQYVAKHIMQFFFSRVILLLHVGVIVVVLQDDHVLFIVLLDFHV